MSPRQCELGDCVLKHKLDALPSHSLLMNLTFKTE